jgi:hypothetical protein
VAGVRLLNGQGLLITDAVAQAILGVTGDLQVALQLFEESFRSSTRRDGNGDREVTELHRQVAEGARQTTIKEYIESHSRKRLRAENDNPKRTSGGVLLGSLKHPQFTVATYDGIGFGNIELLNSRSRQWHRLNFGAGERNRQGGLNITTPVAMFGADVFELKLNRLPGGDGSLFMPRGFFVNPNNQNVVMPDVSRRGRDDFVWLGSNNKRLQGINEEGNLRKIVDRQGRPSAPTSIPVMSPKMKTKGVKGSFYLDKGAAVLARAIGPAWEELIVRWFNRAVDESSGPVRERARKPGSVGLRNVGRLREAVASDLNRSKNDFREIINEGFYSTLNTGGDQFVKVNLDFFDDDF